MKKLHLQVTCKQSAIFFSTGIQNNTTENLSCIVTVAIIGYILTCSCWLHVKEQSPFCCLSGFKICQTPFPSSPGLVDLC